MTLPTITEDQDTIVALKQLEQIYSKPLVYYHEGKPYRILHEGKAKATSIINTAFKIMWPEMFIEPDVEKKLEEAEGEFAKANNGSKWIDVVIYEPLYAECDIRVCVKEKQDFYNNYKSTLDGHNTGT